MRKFAMLLAVSAASMVAVPAFAATIVTNLGTIVVPPTQTISPGVTFGKAGTNSGYYTFHISQNDTAFNAGFSNSPVSGKGIFTFSSIGLYLGTGTTGTELATGFTESFHGTNFATIDPYTLNIGNYTVAYTGTVTGAPAGVGSSFTFASAAVPEASTWAMMMVGFGMMGFGLRRRKSNIKTTISFA